MLVWHCNLTKPTLFLSTRFSTKWRESNMGSTFLAHRVNTFQHLFMTVQHCLVYSPGGWEVCWVELMCTLSEWTSCWARSSADSSGACHPHSLFMHNSIWRQHRHNNNDNNLRLIMVKTNRSILHSVYNIRQSAIQWHDTQTVKQDSNNNQV